MTFFTLCWINCLQISEPIVPAAPVTKIVFFDNFLIFLNLICFLFRIELISFKLRSSILILSEIKNFFSGKYRTSKKLVLIFRIIFSNDFLLREGIVK